MAGHQRRLHTLGSSTFDQTEVNITPDGRLYLGAVIGSPSYVENYVRSKVSSWCSLVNNLADFATIQPHAAYSALNHGLSSKWTYLCRTTPSISHLIKPRDEILPVHSPSTGPHGEPPPNDTESALFALPAREGGLGIRIPSKQAQQEYQFSLCITPPSMITSSTKTVSIVMRSSLINSSPKPLYDRRTKRES